MAKPWSFGWPPSSASALATFLALCFMTIDHGEPKKSRHFTLTDTAYSHLKDIAHEARLSLSETVERLIRITSPWEGNAVLSDGAFSLVEDHSIVSEIEDYEGFSA